GQYRQDLTEPPDTVSAALIVECLAPCEPLMVDDIETHPATRDAAAAFRQAGIGALLAVPLLTDGRCSCAMTIARRSPHGWDDTDVDLVRAVASHCLESVERARVTAALTRRTRSLGLLARSGTRLLAHEQPQDLVATLFDEAAELIDVEVCMHYRLTDDNRRLRLVVCRGLDELTRIEMTSLELGQAICGRAALERQPVICNDVQTRTDEMTAKVRHIGLQAYASFPLLTNGVIVGTLAFGTRHRTTLDADSLDFLHAFAEQLAAAYSRVRAADAVRESEARLQQAVALAGMGTFDIDLLTDVVVVNGAGRAIYGWDEHTPLTFGRVQTHFHPDDRERVVEAVAAAMRPDGSGTFEVEQRIIATGGAVRWIAVRGQAMFEGVAPDRRAARCIGSYLEISERKDADARRERTLEAERTARQHAERAGRMKDEFLATLSHELRTPLNAILGWAELLEQGQLDHEQTRRAIRAVRHNAEAQARLVSDLLDMQHIVSGNTRLDLQPLDVAALVHPAVEALTPSALVKGVQVKVRADAPLRVVGDASRLQQVVWNLVSNAIKFTPEGGRVEVTVSRVDHQAEIVVADSGVGIKPEFLPHVFEPFRQQDASTTRHHGGVGLGLSIVKHLVDLHGGTVRVNSLGEGHGAEVWLTLPLAPAAPADGPHPR
nr:GAF domain-containing protein [Acidobacteriota bacterium]